MERREKGSENSAKGSSSVQFSCSVVSDSLRPQGLQHARPPCPSPTPGVYSNSYLSSWWCHPTISSSVIPLPSIFPSTRVFSNESVLRIRWPKYWSFSFNISPANEHSGLNSFRMDWLDLLAVQGTLKILLQHHGSNASMSSLKTHVHPWRIHVSVRQNQYSIVKQNKVKIKN